MKQLLLSEEELETFMKGLSVELVFLKERPTSYPCNIDYFVSDGYAAIFLDESTTEQ